jgi:hypothetical protein
MSARKVIDFESVHMTLEKFSSASDEDENVTLSDMLAAAERLCKTHDAFMQGQYQHLRGRICALIELRRTVDRQQEKL